MPKDLTFSLLLECYGELLPPKQAELLSSYYDLDLSLSEIGENEGITRQGVRDAIKRAEQQLIQFEAVLGVVEKTNKLKALAIAAKENNTNDELIEYIDNL